MPFMRAASKMLVPAGTRIDWPSIVTSTRPGGVEAVVISGANPNALGFAGAGSGSETDPAGALAFQHVCVNFGAKMFEDRLNRRRRDLTEATDRSKAHGLRELVEKREVSAILGFGDPALRPAHEHVRHFLRANAAGNAFAAGLVAIKTDSVQSHVQHAGGIVANNDRAGTEHRAGFGKRFEIEAHVNHRSRKIARRGAGRRERFQLAASANAACMIEDDLAHRRAHGDFEYSRASHVTTDADKLQTARAAGALRGEPIDTPRENLRHVNESLDVVEHRGLLPETHLHGKRRLVAWFGSMPLNRFHQCGFLAADVPAGADKHFEIEIKLTAEDPFSQETGATAATNLLAKDFFLKMILVADVENAVLRAGDNAGDEHAFDEEMRQIGHNETVFNRAGLAFIGVANDVFHRVTFFADEFPLHAGGKSGPAHTAKFRSLELSEDLVEGPGLNEIANDAVFFGIAVRVGFAFDARGLWMGLKNFFAANGAASNLFGKRGGDIRENMIVDRSGGSMVASAETGNVADLQVLRARTGEAALELGAQFAGAVETATHVRTDANFRLGRRRKMKMRIKTGDTMDLIERDLAAF